MRKLGGTTASLLLLLGVPSPATARAVTSCGGLPATIVGTPGRDHIQGRRGERDVIAALGGADHIEDWGGDNVICGGAGDDEIYAGLGHDLVIGGGGDDRMSAGKGDDLLLGGAGHDGMGGGRGADELRGGRGNDFLTGFRGNDRVNGEEGDDRLYGGLGRDVLRGGDGDDYVGGDEGDDAMFGGAGSDKIDFCYFGPGTSVAPIHLDLAAGVATGRGVDDVDGFERVCTGGGDDVVLGSARDEIIDVEFGDDTVHAGGGDDVVFPGSGYDVIFGEDGDDMFHLEWGEDTFDGGPGFDYVSSRWNDVQSITVDLEAGTAIMAWDTSSISEIEGVYSSDMDDYLYGDAAGNVFYAGAGSDTVDGRDGEDACYEAEVRTSCEI